MPNGERFQAKSYERHSNTITARLQNLTNGAYLLKADITAISYSTYDARAPSTVVNSGTLDKAVCLFDTLQVNLALGCGSLGFNFKQILPKASLPSVGKFITEVKFTPVSGDPFFEAWEIDSGQIMMA